MMTKLHTLIADDVNFNITKIMLHKLPSIIIQTDLADLQFKTQDYVKLYNCCQLNDNILVVWDQYMSRRD